MIIHLHKFMQSERPYWDELERFLKQLEETPGYRWQLPELRRFHYVYERTAAGLARLASFSSEGELRQHLESLVARAYGQLHETPERTGRFRFLAWFFQSLPTCFRRHIQAFWVALGVTTLGALFGGVALSVDHSAKAAVLPLQFSQHLGSPSDRVAEEERARAHPGVGGLTGFSADLMRNNIGVSIKALALGMTYGIGTCLILFYNGIIVGMIAVDYVADGQLRFLLAWLLPHGVIELPATIIAGQAGLVLAHALIGRGSSLRLRARLRAVQSDIVTLISGVALLLVWAGLVEAFLSQYHEPVLPYAVKIAFGITELGLLVLFLARGGSSSSPRAPRRSDQP